MNQSSSPLVTEAGGASLLRGVPVGILAEMEATVITDKLVLTTEHRRQTTHPAVTQHGGSMVVSVDFG